MLTNSPRILISSLYSLRYGRRKEQTRTTKPWR